MNKMKTTKRIMIIGLCTAMCLGTANAAGLIENAEEETEAVTVEAQDIPEEPKEATKDETVYVIAGADGKVQKIIVSDWIKNSLNKASLGDMSDLTDIENVKGDELYTQSGDKKVWDAQGNDIYYQGNIEKELPVGMTVTYMLDGKAMSAQQMAGKSGKVTIRFDYENRQYEMVEIDGEEEKIYVPFAMVTGMILDTDKFTNVEVSNGKIINDGSHVIVAGFAFPGLQENLGVSTEKMEIPDYVEVTAEVKDFEFGMTVTMATNDLFNKAFGDKLDKDDVDLAGSLEQLNDGMAQLTDGSGALYEGLCTLLEKSGGLVEGIDSLTEGSKAIWDGAVSLDEGVGQLQGATNQLSDGLSTLASNNDTLNGGARQVFQTLLATATSQLNAAGLAVPELTIENYAATLNAVIISLDSTTVYNQALGQVTDAVEANRGTIKEMVTAAVREQVKAQVCAAVREQVAAGVNAAVRGQVTEQVILAATGMTKEAYDSALAAGLVSAEQQGGIEAAVEAQMGSDSVKALIESTITAKLETEEIQNTINANTEAQMQTEAVQNTIAQNVELQVQKAISDNMASEAVQGKLTAASQGAQSVIGLKASLDSYNTFYVGLLTYTGGVASASAGANQINAGVGQLKDGSFKLRGGSNALYSGMLQVQDGMPALVEGIKQLRDGSLQLSDGINQINQEGIQKLLELADGGMDKALSRLKATAQVSKEYRNFSGISEDMDGQVKFIYKTAEITMD